MTEEESNQILAEVDADHSDQVDFDEFKLYWVKAKQAGPGEPRKLVWKRPKTKALLDRRGQQDIRRDGSGIG